MQQQVMPRVSVGFAYFRRIFGGFLVTDNIANKAADFTQFNVVGAERQPLPESGRNVHGVRHQPGARRGDAERQHLRVELRQPVPPLERVRRHDGSPAPARHDVQRRRHRRPHDDRQLRDRQAAARSADSAAAASAESPASQFCHNDTGMQPQYKMLGSYMLPYAVRVSGNFQSLPGPGVQAGVLYTGTQMAPALGRPFSAGPNGQKTVNIYDPNTIVLGSPEPARRPVQQDLPHRHRHVRRQLRHLQLVQLRCAAGPDHRLFRRERRHVAAADVGHPGPDHQVRLQVGLLDGFHFGSRRRAGCQSLVLDS